MNDGFQSAYPAGVSTMSGGSSPPAGSGSLAGIMASPAADGNALPADAQVALDAARTRDSRAPGRTPLPEAPLPRWREARAELPALRAQLSRAELERDVDRERLIAAALARALVKRRAELDIALRLARRAVLLGDDTLRMELAGWHCQLGQTALAVGMLVPLLELPGLDRARLSMR